MTALVVDTFGSLLSDMSEKVGETVQNTSDDRKRKINSAYSFVANKRSWWWLESSDTATTTTALTYALPATFRMFHPKNPLKVNTSWYTLVPFESLQLHDGTSSIVTTPYVRSRKYAYIYGTNIIFIQETMTAGQTITYYFYKKITALDNTSDEPLMPADFREMISLYAAGMYLKSQGGREAVEANSYLELFDTYLRDMENEDDNRRKMGIVRRSLDPEESLVYR